MQTTKSILLLFVSYLASLNLFHFFLYLSSSKSTCCTWPSLLLQLLTYPMFFTGDLEVYVSNKPLVNHLDMPPNYYPDYGRNQIYLSKNPHYYHNIVMWAACYIGFLCSSEFTVPLQRAYGKEIYLSPKDIAINNKANSQLLRVMIKQSKTTYTLQTRATLFLGRKESSICPMTQDFIFGG